MENLKTPPGDLCYEIERLLTFSENIHPTLTAIELAANGYYYDSTEGKIMCFFCESVLEFSDSTFKHKYSCRHKDDNCPVYLHDDTKSENVISSNKNEILNMQKRLDTFENWNPSVPVAPTDLAKNGFYYLGYRNIVKCAYCSVHLYKWKENYDVYEEHTRLNPECPILRYLRKMDLEYEQNLQKSFVKWPTHHPLKAKDLVANGFYYKGPADNVCCIFCKCEINNWKASDNIKEKHRSISPNCPFLCEKLIGNVPTSNQSNKFDSPVHPHFTSLSERLKTFSSWPKNKSQKPESLADAGFFHNGKSDTVICFSCGRTLCDWDEDEEPWHKHAQYSPKCTFVQQMKGSKYITEASGKSKEFSNNQELENSSPIENYLSEPTEGSSSVEDVTAFPNTPASGILPKFADLKLNSSFMDTPSVLAVLSIGYKRNLVKRIVKNKIKETGSSFSSASELLEVIEKSSDLNDVNDVNDEEQGAQAGIRDSNADLIAENNMLKEGQLCKICLDEKLSVVFLPCGHFVCCVTCGSLLTVCPVCRKNILHLVKVIF
ncbi:baculoviral IAP repeat-containing protein 7-A [Octopus vulgaris]|uniref:Baculoviral IAP repeat-containing protein 7-A n=2 Tax=Octopus TaxID=6643 RepID=A0AA36AJI7_OCTVU|nr:baculoviral IAP repeat-containing protein 7-A [Octopus sinensis]XP_036356298.1 baculoviral IAP repeat-containing protein 7-A [Octopus sinensis]XP_036356299.1 baculoviral IAP repeat-containing protein 7-A [Octopus sinensis]XP_036356300.1 baculoviral IAP repeat-containing protein 7-A [Octopus sinensis]XP_036356301.1 baculoviral IAP repeat-containing protein 7-A [Octopus sinensis]XP_036356302.1 baculoviral IAP repeat-containing protein 7-A [Octopus sinensis]XP_036356303.1 baculoviral IAP repe